MDDFLDSLNCFADRHVSAQGFASLPIAGMDMMRVHAPTTKIHALYRPMLCLVLQGEKQLVTERQSLHFKAGQSLVVNADMPVIGRVTQATAHIPYMALSVTLDMAMMQALSVQMASTPAAANEPCVAQFASDRRVLDCAMRLVGIMEDPQARDLLAPGLLRELHYWLLVGPHGDLLRHAALPEGHAQRIGRATARLRRDFASALSVEALAAEAGMSLSSFHHHFRALTSLTPVQFRQHLRLLEGRRYGIRGDECHDRCFCSGV